MSAVASPSRGAVLIAVEKACKAASEGRATQWELTPDGRARAYYRRPYDRAPAWHDLGPASELVRQFGEQA